MDANSMDKELIEFLTRDHDPIDIGKFYNQSFPIYPGEVVILQAPPKSMKTMLLQAQKKNIFYRNGNVC